MFFNFVFMFLWFYPPSAKTETKDTYKIPCRLYVNRGHFYFGQRDQPYFGFGGQINLGPRGHPRLGFPIKLKNITDQTDGIANDRVNLVRIY